MSNRLARMNSVRCVIITLPAHNEEATIGNVLTAISRTMATMPGITWQTVVVDDCSTDSTAAIARSHGATVISLPQKSGLAEVFRQEMRTALQLGADWIVHLDSDGQHPPEAIPALLARLDEGLELVVGSRFLGQSPPGKPAIEQFESRSFSRLLGWITGHPFTDVHSGFRAFTRRVAVDIPIQSNFSYVREQLFRASARGYRIGEIPVVAAPRKSGRSRLFKNRHKALLAVTWRYCRWTLEEKTSPLKIPVILVWGVGTAAVSWGVRLLYRAGIVKPVVSPRVPPKAHQTLE